MVKFFPVVTFPSLSTTNAFTAALAPSFVANTIRSSPPTVTGPSPSTTTPSIVVPL